MDPHLEVLTGVLVHVRATDDAVAVDLRGQRNRALDAGLGPEHGLRDLLRRLVDHVVVVSLQANADLLFAHMHSLRSCVPGTWY